MHVKLFCFILQMRCSGRIINIVVNAINYRMKTSEALHSSLAFLTAVQLSFWRAMLHAFYVRTGCDAVVVKTVPTPWGSKHFLLIGN